LMLPLISTSQDELLSLHDALPISNEADVGQHYALWLEEKGCENWRDYFVEPTGTMDKEVEHKWPIPERYHYNTWIAERTNQKLRSEEHTSELQSRFDLVCRLLLEK